MCTTSSTRAASAIRSPSHSSSAGLASHHSLFARSFDVTLRSDGRFFCQKFQAAKAKWAVAEKDGKQVLSIDWMKYGAAPPADCTHLTHHLSRATAVRPCAPVRFHVRSYGPDRSPLCGGAMPRDTPARTFTHGQRSPDSPHTRLAGKYELEVTDAAAKTLSGSAVGKGTRPAHRAYCPARMHPRRTNHPILALSDARMKSKITTVLRELSTLACSHRDGAEREEWGGVRCDGMGWDGTVLFLSPSGHIMPPGIYLKDPHPLSPTLTCLGTCAGVGPC